MTGIFSTENQPIKFFCTGFFWYLMYSKGLSKGSYIMTSLQRGGGGGFTVLVMEGATLRGGGGFPAFVMSPW